MHVDTVGARAVGGHATGYVHASDCSVGLHGNHVRTGGSDLAPDGDRADLGAGLTLSGIALRKVCTPLTRLCPSPPSVVRSPQISRMGKGLLA